jgi:pimeloyl-ACP methyl ester carboxylesterase/DNA-binding winged helix-turn-helix (wHTH) protein
MIYSFADCELDLGLYELRRSGETVAVEPQVFDVLAYLVTNHDRLVSKNELVERIWPERFISEGALNSRLMSARKAIGDDGQEQRLIRTLHGRGYRFVAAVQARSEPAEPVPEQGQNEQSLKEVAPGVSQVPVAASQRIGFCTTRDGVRLAHAVVGEGPPLVKAPNWLSHLEYEWRSPVWRHWLKELSSIHTLVRYDQRGNGLSDREVDEISFEAHVRDLEAVVDALGLERFPMIGISQGGPFAVAYAIRHPERVSHLILYGAYARGFRRRGLSAEALEEREARILLTRQGWGRDNPAYRQLFATLFVPGASQEQMNWFNDLCRISASPETAARLMSANATIDVDYMLPKIEIPTLVLHARNDEAISFEEGRRMAALIRSARFVPLEGANHILLETEPAWETFCREVRAFLGS